MSGFAEFRSAVSEKKSKYVSINERQGKPYCFFNKAEKHKLGRGRWELALSSFVEFHSAVSKKSKMSQQIRGQGGYLVFLIGPKNANLVEDVEILLPVKFHWILFRGFRGKVENVSANQSLGWPSCFSDQPEKHKLGRGLWDLASCQVLLNSFQWFERRSKQEPQGALIAHLSTMGS